MRATYRGNLFSSFDANVGSAEVYHDIDKKQEIDQAVKKQKVRGIRVLTGLNLLTHAQVRLVNLLRVDKQYCMARRNN